MYQYINVSLRNGINAHINGEYTLRTETQFGGRYYYDKVTEEGELQVNAIKKESDNSYVSNVCMFGKIQDNFFLPAEQM